jgi:hypothetical protein
MGSVLKPGPGAVTVYYNAGHTFMKIGDRYWGTSVGDSGSGGLGPTPTLRAAISRSTTSATFPASARRRQGAEREEEACQGQAAYGSQAASGAPAASTGALSSKYGHPAV